MRRYIKYRSFVYFILTIIILIFIVQLIIKREHAFENLSENDLLLQKTCEHFTEFEKLLPHSNKSTKTQNCICSELNKQKINSYISAIEELKKYHHVHSVCDFDFEAGCTIVPILLVTNATYNVFDMSDVLANENFRIKWIKSKFFNRYIRIYARDEMENRKFEGNCDIIHIKDFSQITINNFAYLASKNSLILIDNCPQNVSSIIPCIRYIEATRDSNKDILDNVSWCIGNCNSLFTSKGFPNFNSYIFLNKTFCKAPWYGRKCDKRNSTPCTNQSNQCFYNDETGVVWVSCEQWHRAQQKEQLYWDYSKTDNDRNEGHEISFDSYSSLPKSLGHVLELGCGPFTQSQNILKSRHSSSITLLDPMAFHYMTDVSRCFYKNGSFKDLPTTILSIPAEEFSISRQFDTLVMINVIEHVHDGLNILDMAVNMIKENGILVWHEHTWNSFMGVPFGHTKKYIFDFLLHPIRIKTSIVKQMMKMFEPLYVSFDTEELRRTRLNGVYFIGKKKEPFSVTLLPEPVSCIDKTKGHQAIVFFISNDNRSWLIDEIKMAEISSNVGKIILVQTTQMYLMDVHRILKNVKIHVFISVQHFQHWEKEVNYYAGSCKMMIPHLTWMKIKGNHTICVGNWTQPSE